MLRDDDDRGMTISQWRKTIERDRAAQARPVVIAFFSPETFRDGSRHWTLPMLTSSPRSRMIPMSSDSPDLPDNPWDTNVHQRDRRVSEDEARAVEIKRGLFGGDPSPLISAIFRRQIITPPTYRVIAALFEPHPRLNEEVPTFFRLLPAHGHLKEYLEPDEAKCVKVIMGSVPKMANGARPPDPPEGYPSFWDVLGKGLALGHPDCCLTPPLEYPVKIELGFREPVRGRRPDTWASTYYDAMRQWWEQLQERAVLSPVAALEQTAKDWHCSFETARAAVYGKKR
jgi:hypothetical protein